ncbi:ABC transporter permease [Synoicihabitans lomoniglobus]|uniref:ABC transporter permease n=1 Tax=Synoicihabitans lomoniglobus TaxID=2909285 RepID=A0AAF0CQF8_9BACT|nr:ABC transporter permease [Opitutaceae bacterium LMO-M01]WED66175.1 ABC transporter permease [Opitutaceae bacterium LMO-M01]
MSVLRHALGQLAKSPGFSLLSLALLAVGIGATSAILTLVNSVLLRPIDYPASDALVAIRQSRLPEFPSLSVCPADYFDFRTGSDCFDEMYAARGDSLILTGRGEPSRVRALRATAGIFDTLRVMPAQGRAFTAIDDRPGAPRVLVVLHDFWQSHLGGRPGAVGQTLQLNGQPVTIIGIMPPGFQTEPTSDMITPMAFTAEESAERGIHHIQVVARLRTNTSVATANSQLVAIANQLARDYPVDNGGWSAFAIPLLQWHTRDVGTTLYTLLGAVAFLLLIACANVGNLVLVRATGRHHEISIRIALGASRWQLTRMLLAESLVLGILGGAVGLLLAHWSLDALVAFGGEHIPRANEIQLDHRVVGFTVLLSLLVGVIFGLAPVGRTNAHNLVASLKSGPRGTVDDLRHHTIRQWLIVTEIALALVLLNTAGLLGRSFLRLVRTDPGFNATGAWSVSLEVPAERYDSPEKLAAIAEKLSARLDRIDQVTVTGYSSVLPFTRNNQVMRVQFPDRFDNAGMDASAYYFAISPDYLRAMQIPLMAGRNFDAADDGDAPRVALVSESFARKFYGDTDPLNQRVHITNTPEPQWRIIVGVVRDVKQFGLEQTESVQIYEPFAQTPGTRLAFVVRAARTSTGLGEDIRRAVLAVDPDQPVFSIRPINDLIGDSTARRRFALVLLGVFSAIALVLACCGVYGVISFSVATRTREIGVRMALGARPAQVLRVVFRRGLHLVAMGLVVGSVASMGLGYILGSQLHATSGHDPLVFIAVAVLMAIVSIVACLMPARQATRVDPLVAIRAE